MGGDEEGVVLSCDNEFRGVKLVMWNGRGVELLEVYAGAGDVVLWRKVVVVWIGKPTAVTLTDKFGCPTRFITAVDPTYPRRVEAPEGFARPLRVKGTRHSAHPPGVKTSGHPRCVVVLARAPDVRGLEVEER